MTQLDLLSWRPPKKRKPRKPSASGACEWKIIRLRETAPDAMPECEHPDDAVAYWRRHITSAPHFNPDVECLAVLLLNTRRRIRGHHLVSIGTLNETSAHPREIFRAAVIAAAWGIVLMHNHPSGDPTPSDADIRLTRRIVSAGELLQIPATDHIIVGHGQHCSLRAAGIIH